MANVGDCIEAVGVRDKYRTTWCTGVFSPPTAKMQYVYPLPFITTSSFGQLAMERVFYRLDCTDAYTGLPIYIFDTSYLPSPELIDYDGFIPTLMKHVPRLPYVLCMFSCGLNRVSWIWGIKFVKLFLDPDANNLHNLAKIITVHDSWFVKLVTQILTNYSSTKKSLSQLNRIFEPDTLVAPAAGLVASCSTLSDLSHYVDITKLKLSLNVYKHDLQHEPHIAFAHPIQRLIVPNSTILHRHPVLYHHFYQIFNILNLYGDRVERLFHRPGNKVNSDILYRCVLRNQLIWINDWDLYCILTVFKRLLLDLPHPLVPSDTIVLPMKDDFQSTLVAFNTVVAGYNAHDPNYALVLYQLMDLCSRMAANSEITGHTSLTLAKCLSHCLAQELVLHQNRDLVLVVSRFVKNVLDHWSGIQPLYHGKYQTVAQIISGEELVCEKLDDSYDLSYDITIDAPENTDESDENDDKTFNTSSILTDTSQNPPNAATPASSPVSRQAPPTPASLVSNSSAVVSVTSENSVFSSHVPKAHVRQLSDVSNVQVQFPPQKYKFSVEKVAPRPLKTAVSSTLLNQASRKPVIRGRKVGELARLYEERAQGLDILKGM